MRSVRLLLCMSIALALCLSPLFVAPAGAWTIGPFVHMTIAGSHATGICEGPDAAMWFTEPDNDKIGRVTAAWALTEYDVPTASLSFRFT